MRQDLPWMMENGMSDSEIRCFLPLDLHLEFENFHPRS